jgi:ribosomal protein S18 acetylase RimI-like enzyme
MSEPVHLHPGSEMPAWAVELDRAVFGEVWGSLAASEHLFGWAPEAYSRWSIVPAAQEAELLRIAVAPEARRLGHAKRLLEASESFLQGEGIATLHLEVRCSNLAARHLYESSGWTLQRTRKAYYQDGEDALIYRKQLER